MKTTIKLLMVLGAMVLAFMFGIASQQKTLKRGLEASNEEIRKGYEKTYFWAQVDAREGLWRVSEYDESGSYVWIGTPNKVGEFPRYDPSEDVLNYASFKSQRKLESIEKTPLNVIQEKAKEAAESIKQTADSLVKRE